MLSYKYKEKLEKFRYYLEKLKLPLIQLMNVFFRLIYQLHCLNSIFTLYV